MDSKKSWIARCPAGAGWVEAEAELTAGACALVTAGVGADGVGAVVRRLPARKTY